MKYFAPLYCPLSLLVLLLLSSCATLPPNDFAPETYALQDTSDTKFGRKFHSLKEEHPKESGFFLLSNGVDAFTARIAVAEYAERSIDAQYYMIHDDKTGNLFWEQLIKAADRGVSVRILIDDMDLEKRDNDLIVLASHPNIALRVFNPFSRSVGRTSQFVTGFGSVTRRMHNKSFTIDNQITIVGGRNIGDEYFNAHSDLTFADLDILAIGPVVKEVSESFDEFWNSDLAYPIQTLRPDRVDEKSYAEGIKALKQYLQNDSVQKYKKRLIKSSLLRNIQEKKIVFILGNATVLSDSPGKLAGYDADYSLTLKSELDQYRLAITKELLIFSPYFVPGKTGTRFLCNLSKKGVVVRILTNSLASTDVGIVHSGYAKYRKTLLRAGVELYEINDTSRAKKDTAAKDNSSSSKASLHAKTFVLDREKAFIGSFNLDPRSMVENTEIGIMVSSTELAEQMAGGFDTTVENTAFHLELVTTEDGMENIIWHGFEDGQEKTWNNDPHTTWLQRVGVFFLGLLPVESQL